MALTSACSDDDDGGMNSADGAADVPRIDSSIPRPDGSSIKDGSVPSDAPVDSNQPDAGGDADAEASALPSLCETYKLETIDGGGVPNEPVGAHRYILIGYRAVYTGEQNLYSSCELGGVPLSFDDSAPLSEYCLGWQLASLAGCKDSLTGNVSDYSKAQDDNQIDCIGAKGNVQLGFLNPEMNNYSDRDVDFMAELVRKAAISTGMAPADAERLKAAYLEKRSTVVLTDAGSDYTHRHPEQDAAACP
jgi:hypothetical protein